MQGNYPEALIYFEKALEILRKPGLSESPNAKKVRENIENLKSKTKFRPQRRKHPKIGRNEPYPCACHLMRLFVF